jgi:hypothetical protein
MSQLRPVPGIPGAVILRVDALPDELAGGVPAGHATSAKPGQLLFTVPRAGRFFVRDGMVIEFAEAPDADPGKVELFLHGTARGALIHQRGELPLHAATLASPDGETALAICGRSGAGKSTLAMELSRRGWLLVADDTTRITWDDAGPIAWPSRDSIKLWRDSCETNKLDCSALTQVTQDMDKFYVRVAAVDRPIPFKTVVELVVDEEATPVTSPGDRMALLSRHAYRAAHIAPLGKQRDHVRIVAQVASACSMFRLPGGGALEVRALADAVEKML